MNNTPEMQALKTRLKAMWEAGDYGVFARYLEPGAMSFLADVPVEPGMRVLDVACGAGQTAIPMAKAGAMVTGVDIASNLIQQARARAEKEGVQVRFEEGDAEELPYDHASFDLVFSLIGAMFAPQPDKVTAELLRVCKPGGRIVMGNWTPGGFIGQMFKIHGKHVPPPPGMPSPVLWGDEATVRERLREGVSDLRFRRLMYPFKYPFPPVEVVEFFRSYYGPTNRAFAALEGDQQMALRRELEQHWSTHNRATDGGTHIEAELLEVVAVRA